MSTFRSAVKLVDEEHPNISTHAFFVLSMDENDVSGVNGAQTKVFGSSTTHNSGVRGCFRKGMDKRLTAIFATSVGDQVVRPMVIFEGMYQMERWFEPLLSKLFKDEKGNPEWFAKHEWFSNDGIFVGTSRGAMKMQTMPIFLQHFQRQVHKIVLSLQHVCLILNGHSSRNGREWLETCEKNQISDVQLPAHATYILQPNTGAVKKCFRKVCVLSAIQF